MLLKIFSHPDAFFRTRKDSIQIGMDLSNVNHSKLAIFRTTLSNYKPSNVDGKIFDQFILEKPKNLPNYGIVHFTKRAQKKISISTKFFNLPFNELKLSSHQTINHHVQLCKTVNIFKFYFILILIRPGFGGELSESGDLSEV